MAGWTEEDSPPPGEAHFDAMKDEIKQDFRGVKMACLEGDTFVSILEEGLQNLYNEFTWHRPPGSRNLL